MDVFERGEVRTELLKELERQQRKLQAWIEVPGVDQSRIDALRQQLKTAGSILISAPRMGQFLREDRLIALVRQRLSIPGGCCSFDLPTLHIWLHMSQAQRDAQVDSWLASLNPLNQALTLILDLIRNSAPFRKQTSLNGFYQDNGKMRIYCACNCRWVYSFIRKFPATKAVLRSVLCRSIATMAWCLNASISNWPAVKE